MKYNKALIKRVFEIKEQLKDEESKQTLELMISDYNKMYADSQEIQSGYQEMLNQEAELNRQIGLLKSKIDYYKQKTKKLRGY